MFDELSADGFQDLGLESNKKKSNKLVNKKWHIPIKGRSITFKNKTISWKDKKIPFTGKMLIGLFIISLLAAFIVPYSISNSSNNVVLHTTYTTEYVAPNLNFTVTSEKNATYFLMIEVFGGKTIEPLTGFRTIFTGKKSWIMTSQTFTISVGEEKNHSFPISLETGKDWEITTRVCIVDEDTKILETKT